MSTAQHAHAAFGGAISADRATNYALGSVLRTSAADKRELATTLGYPPRNCAPSPSERGGRVPACQLGA